MRPPDANDILRRHGPDVLRKVIDGAATINRKAFAERTNFRRTNIIRVFELVRFEAVLLSTSAAYLVKGLIPRAGLTVVWGPPKCGKSFWAFDLAMHVARGVPYRGRRVQQGAVVYLALEGGYGFRARVDAYRRTHGIKDAPFYQCRHQTEPASYKTLPTSLPTLRGRSARHSPLWWSSTRSIDRWWARKARTRTWRHTSAPPTQSAKRSIAPLWSSTIAVSTGPGHAVTRP